MNKKNTAIVAPAKEVSPIREIMQRIENVRALHTFINKNLNVAYKKRVSKLAPGQKLTDKERIELEIDYGTIPGSKPFLKQPGAEKILRWAYCRPEYETAVEALHDGHLEVISRVRLKATADGTEVFSGPMCSCSSMESNFRFRWLEREPKPAKEESDRLKKLGAGRLRKEKRWVNGKQVEEWVWQDRIENPNIYDERNNVRQRSEKRALVKCVRQFGALSEIFTTDPNDWDAQGDEGEVDYEPQGRVVMEEPIDVSPEPEKASPEPPVLHSDPSWPVITIDWTDEAAPIVTGDSEAFKPLFDAYCKWGSDGFWRTEPRHVESIRSTAPAMKFQVKEIMPKKVPPKPSEGQTGSGAALSQGTTRSQPAPQSSRKEAKPPQPAGASSTPNTPSAGPLVVQGILERVISGTTGKNQPLRQVTVLLPDKRKPTFACFDIKLFQYLDKGLGKEAEIFVLTRGKYTNLIGLKRIASTYFEDNVPIIQQSTREAGTGTLWEATKS